MCWKWQSPVETSKEMTSLNTACERIDHALQRIEAKGWTKHFIRGAKRGDWDAAGPSCLVGGLISDEEYKTFLPEDRDDFGKTLDAFRPIYAGSLPGLIEAVNALGFHSVIDAAVWNDSNSRKREQVIERLQMGKTQACH